MRRYEKRLLTLNNLNIPTVSVRELMYYMMGQKTGLLFEKCKSAMYVRVQVSQFLYTPYVFEHRAVYNIRNMCIRIFITANIYLRVHKSI